MEEKQWFESENFWNNYAPIMFDEQRWAEAPAVAKAVAQIANLQKGAAVLDAGCGIGRISVELALLDFAVTGVDLIKSELEAAAESAKDESVSLNLIQADLRSFKLQNHNLNQFDAAVNLYTSFGYCATPEEDALILKSIFDSVKDGGFFLLENISRECAVKNFTKGEEFLRAGKIVRTEFSMEGAWEGLRSRWILEDEKTHEIIDHEFVQRLYSAAELKKTLLQIGFKSAEIYGGFDLRPYDETMETMLIVCQK